jgi:hypothetical protein
MKTVSLGLAVFLGFLLFGCTTANGIVKPVAISEFFGRTCPVEARFGSYAAGIDQETYKATLALLRTDTGVAKIETKAWGREGEKAICIDVKRKADAKRVYDRIRELFSRKREHKGPVSVFLA